MQRLIQRLNKEVETIENRLESYKEKDNKNETIFAIENRAMLEGRLLQIKEVFKWIEDPENILNS